MTEEAQLPVTQADGVSVALHPVIPGFYPDPSICRVGDRYYLANSTFEYYPGVPIWTSTDLRSWSQVGHVITRPDQMAPADRRPSSGIYAPTLRFHDARFWLIVTDVGGPASEQLIFTAEDPARPWSSAVRTVGVSGIDPDLTWDGDDCFLTWAAFAPAGSTIMQVRVDPQTGRLLEQPRALWAGTGLRYPEGPHLYRRGDWWYLLIAEGGTEAGHCVCVARSRRPDGGFESAPQNPIFTHRSLAKAVQNVGHADLVELEDGSWAMVYLGVRKRGAGNFHVNGRETFLAGVRWEEDWPVVDEDVFTIPRSPTSFEEDFAAEDLHPRWVSPGQYPGALVRRTAQGLLLQGEGKPALLAARTRDDCWRAWTDLEVESGQARLLVRMDGRHWFGVEVGSGTVSAVGVVGGARVGLGQQAVADAGVRVFLEAVPAEAVDGADPVGPDLLRAGVELDGRSLVLGEWDGRYLSTEVTGGFTGRVFGVEVEGGRTLVRRVHYEPTGAREGR